MGKESPMEAQNRPGRLQQQPGPESQVLQQLLPPEVLVEEDLSVTTFDFMTCEAGMYATVSTSL
jgi:hypothetical protein